MTEVLQDQVARTTDALGRLQALQFDLVLDRIALHSVAAVVTMGCAVLLLRTAAGTLHSRFLRHLAASVALNVVFRLGTIVNLLLGAGLAFIAAGNQPDPAAPVAGQVAQALATLESTWHGIDITISLLGSWFLITTWNLLRRYPNEGVDRSLYAALTAAFGAGILAVLSNLLELAQEVQRHLWQILDVMDLTAATLGLLLVGWQLHYTMGPKIKTKNIVVRTTLPWTTAFLYLIWGGMQPFYPWFKNSSGYSVMILMGGVSAIIMTVILCSQVLEEKM